jgi:hypothetical protein
VLSGSLLLALLGGIFILRHPSSELLPLPKYLTALPGQQTWADGVNSYLFGTNDTYEWSSENIESRTDIQFAIRTAGFTLLRSFFRDHASDAEIDQRAQTIKNTGAQCLGVITNIADATFDEHLIEYLGQRCLLYEFGNESDYNGISAKTYLAQWNALIPQLRRINPFARFIGPVTYNDLGVHDFMQAYLDGVKVSGVLPDAISFHWYPCYHDSKESCLAKAGTYADAVTSVRRMVLSTLGKELPVGVTEWNYDPGNPPPSYGDDAGFMTSFSVAAIHAMIAAGAVFACQFDAASYGGYGRLDMFDVTTGQPKPQYVALKHLIATYRPAAAAPTLAPPQAPSP